MSEIADIRNIKTLFDLYNQWKFDEIESLLDSTILSLRLTSNKSYFIKCTTASETIYDAFASWCKEQINDFDFVVKYGDRKISRATEKILHAYAIVYDNESVSDWCDYTIDRIYDLVMKKNIDNWLKKFSAYNLTAYKPLDNYNMEEVRTPDLTEEIDYTQVINDIRKEDTDITSTTNSDSKTGIFGFNSSGTTSNPTADGTGNTTVNTVGDGEDNKVTTDNEKTNVGTKTNTGTETLTRSGNIGVTTSQQMLQSELELRNQILVDEIYKALAQFMTNPVY